MTRHKVSVEYMKFSLMVDEVIRHWIDESTEHDLMKPWDEILFQSEGENRREALFTITHIDKREGGDGWLMGICSIRLEKWAKGNSIMDDEAVPSRVPDKNYGICV